MTRMDIALEGERGKRAVASREKIKQAADSGGIVEVKCVRCEKDGTLVVLDADNNSYRIPFEEVSFRPDGITPKTITALTCVGRNIRVAVTKHYDTYNLSRKLSQQRTNDYIRENWHPGDILNCRVVGISKYGVFVDIGNGLNAMLPESRISYSYRMGRAYDFEPGKYVQAVYYQNDENRIYVSMRELLGDWEQNADRFAEGETVPGIVSGVEDFGVFIELAPNFRGLADLDPDIHVSVGDAMPVFIKAIDYGRGKVKLVMIKPTTGITKAHVDFYSYYQYLRKDKSRHMDKWVYCDKYDPNIRATRSMGTDFTVSSHRKQT